MVESLLLSTTRVLTFVGTRPSTGASGFFFRRDGALFLVSSRHVLLDEESDHRPDRIEIEVHVGRVTLASSAVISILLYDKGTAVWREASDIAGAIDVAVIPLDETAWPEDAVIHPFGPEDLVDSLDSVRVGAPLLVPGYPLGFHDTVHHLPVVRQACVASAFGVRFQGQGYFLTDGRTHRGTSGAPVVAVAEQDDDRSGAAWRLLGVHSSRMDMRDRDLQLDESLGLNCAWYADVLMPLTGGGQRQV